MKSEESVSISVALPGGSELSLGRLCSMKKWEENLKSRWDRPEHDDGPKSSLPEPESASPSSVDGSPLQSNSRSCSELRTSDEC